MLIFTIIVLCSGAVWYELYGPMLYDGVSLYVAMYLATLSAATYQVYRSGDVARYQILGYVYLCSFSSIILGLFNANLLLISWSYVAYALPLTAFGSSLRHGAIASLFIVAALCGLPAWLGVLPALHERPDVFIALAYPDLIALTGHLINISMGSGGRDVEQLSAVRAVIMGFAERRLSDHRGFTRVQNRQVTTEAKK